MNKYFIDYEGKNNKEISPIQKAGGITGGIENVIETGFISKNYLDKSPISGGGYGLFTSVDYKKGDIVEVNPFREYTENYSGLERYRHGSHLTDGKYLLVLGNGSMLNHNKDENLCHYYMKDKQFYVYFAKRDIKKGEELFINYGDDVKF